MASNYPTSLDTTTELPADQTDGTLTNRAGTDHAGEHVNLSGAVRALQAKLGIGADTAATGEIAASTGSGASGWTNNPQIGTGDNVSIIAAEAPPGLRGQIYHGTAASPETDGPGCTLRVNRTDAITRAERDSWSGVAAGGQTLDDVPAICGAVQGTAASQVQVVGVTGVAHNAGTGTGGSGGGPDACGVAGHAWQKDSGAIGRAIGGYFAGRWEIAAPAKISGIEVQSQNHSGTDDTYSSTGASDTIGVLVSCGSSAYDNSGVGIGYYHASGEPKFDVGIGFNSIDGGPCASSTIRDDGSAPISIDIRGTHATAAISIAAGAGTIETDNNSIVQTSGYLQQTERSTPSTPGANIARIFTRDSGGVTQFCMVGSGGNVCAMGADVAAPDYTVSNVTTDRTFNANSYTMDELADVLGTVIQDLQAMGRFT